MKSLLLRKVTLLILLAFILYACSVQQPSISKDLQDSFQEMVSISDLNTSLSIKLVSTQEKELAFGKNVTIRVENIGDKEIFFPVTAEFARIFIIRDNKWLEIKNTAQYFSLQSQDGSILQPKGGKQPNIFTTGVCPVLEQQSTATQNTQFTVRILISGELMNNSEKTGIPVGAYIDLFMKEQ